MPPAQNNSAPPGGQPSRNSTSMALKNIGSYMWLSRMNGFRYLIVHWPAATAQGLLAAMHPVWYTHTSTPTYQHTALPLQCPALPNTLLLSCSCHWCQQNSPPILPKPRTHSMGCTQAVPEVLQVTWRSPPLQHKQQKLSPFLALTQHWQHHAAPAVPKHLAQPRQAGWQSPLCWHPLQGSLPF